MKPIDGRVVTIKLPEEMIREVDRIANKRKMSRADVYRMMVDLGLELHRDMEAVGVIAAVDFVYYCRQALREKVAGQSAVRVISDQMNLPWGKRG